MAMPPEAKRDIGNFGSWKEEANRLEINITDDSMPIELKIKGALVLTIDKGRAEIIIPKKDQKSDSSDSSGKRATDDKSKNGAKTDDKSKNGAQTTTDEKPTNDAKPTNETTLENVLTKLKTYKGIVITAIIAISLGFLLRRKFKAAGH